MKSRKSRSCRPKPVIEATRFPKVDGIGATKGEYIDINLKAKDRLFIRYIPIADSGVELERVRGEVILWRVHTAPLGVEHSAYNHKVWVRLETQLVSRIMDPKKYSGMNPNGLTGRILIYSIGFKLIREIRALATGQLLSRTIHPRKALTPGLH
jgi:hypothetical protein